MEGRVVHIRQVLEQLGLALGRFAVLLAARQHVEVGAPALLAADHPVHRLTDHVVGQWRLAALLQLLALVLVPLDVVVIVFILGLLDARGFLAIQFALVVPHQGGVQIHGFFAIQHMGRRRLALVLLDAAHVVATDHPRAALVAQVKRFGLKHLQESPHAGVCPTRW
ncbi:hypothetical protein D3C71_1624990 [compost metagenome]